jgi:hypothetical protein
VFEYKRALEVPSVIEGRLVEELTTSSLVQLSLCILPVEGVEAEPR